jgi:hypothetical protein
MKDQMKTRLAELKAEFAKGKQKLDELESQTREVQHALLRISGAIQVLEELSQNNSDGADALGPSIAAPLDMTHAGQTR